MRIIVICLLLFPVAAFAQQKDTAKFTIDFTAKLIGYNGDALFRPADDCAGKDKSGNPKIAGVTCGKDDLTLGMVAIDALEAPLESDRNEDFTKKLDRDRLARRIYHNPAASLSAEEIALIKDRIAKYWASAAVAGAAGPLLDPSLRP